MLYFAPESIVREASFGDKAVDMWVPFQRAAEGVEDTDKTGSEIPGLIYLVEHLVDDRACGIEETVQTGPVFEKVGSELFRYCKNTVPVGTVDQFAGHSFSTFSCI